MTRPRPRRATPADRPEVAALRTRVFVAEQGVPAEIEQDAAQATAVHALSRDDEGRVAATRRLLVDRRPVTIGRMAADATVRGRGHGAGVLDELHWQAVLAGVTQVELHAQVTARRFYDRAGYTAVGRSTWRPGSRTSPCAAGCPCCARHGRTTPRASPACSGGTRPATVPASWRRRAGCSPWWP